MDEASHGLLPTALKPHAEKETLPHKLEVLLTKKECKVDKHGQTLVRRLLEFDPKKRLKMDKLPLRELFA
ncbi:hypothetical protein BG015_002238, partial [Linnemannia schmuckeri]